MTNSTNAASTHWYAGAGPAPAGEPPSFVSESAELGPLLGDIGANITVAADGTPTLYRRDSLLASAAAVRRSPEAIGEINARLAPIGVSIEAPDVADDADEVAFRLVGTDTDGPDADAVREFARNADGLSAPTAEVVASLSLDHLLFVGTPAKDGFSGMPAKDGFSVYGGHPGTAREAVVVVGDAPARRPLDMLPGGRRPVVALIDSGIADHPWLDADSFWVDAADLHWVPKAPARVVPDYATGNTNPTDGILDSHAGHGTFIAGLIRQLAPDATVLSMHVMRDGGVLEETLVLDALGWLRDRVRGAATDPTLFVDVVSLSFGYYETWPEDRVHTAKLRQLLGELGDMGVRVVASCGNHDNELPVCPAVFAASQYASTAPRTALISVGALNPDGSRAAYSNHGPWVTHLVVGTSLVSPMPRYGHPLSADEQAEYDPSNLSGGFARWSGTSFATGVLAGRLARALTDDPRCVAAALDMRPDASHDRARWALEVAYGHDG